MTTEERNDLTARLDRIEQTLGLLVQQRATKEWYSTGEVAKLLDKAEFTVREWCRLGKVKAEKKKSGRGVASEWIISHEELTRVRNEGLLPDPRPYRHIHWIAAISEGTKWANCGDLANRIWGQNADNIAFAGPTWVQFNRRGELS
jgi:hypothetical protein